MKALFFAILLAAVIGGVYVLFFRNSATAGPSLVGQEAPAPACVNQDGTAIDFAALYAKGPTVVFFYPKASTPGCTAQACSLRDAFADLTKQGVQVIGVSTDDAASQKAFRDKQRLPFDLVPDPTGAVLKAFGVAKMLGGLAPVASRQCFLVRDGKVVWHDASASTSQQAADILKALGS